MILELRYNNIQYYVSPYMSTACDRCRGPIINRSEAVVCTHFGALPTLSHRACASVPSQHAPVAILKISVDVLPVFLMINLVNVMVGILFTLWGIFEILNATNSLFPVFPMGLFMGPILVVIGGFMYSSIMKIQKRASGLIA